MVGSSTLRNTAIEWRQKFTALREIAAAKKRSMQLLEHTAWRMLDDGPEEWWDVLEWMRTHIADTSGTKLPVEQWFACPSYTHRWCAWLLALPESADPGQWVYAAEEEKCVFRPMTGEQMLEAWVSMWRPEKKEEATPERAIAAATPPAVGKKRRAVDVGSPAGPASVPSAPSTAVSARATQKEQQAPCSLMEMAIRKFRNTPGMFFAHDGEACMANSAMPDGVEESARRIQFRTSCEGRTREITRYTTRKLWQIPSPSMDLLTPQHAPALRIMHLVTISVLLEMLGIAKWWSKGPVPFKKFESWCVDTEGGECRHPHKSTKVNTGFKDMKLMVWFRQQCSWWWGCRGPQNLPYPVAMFMEVLFGNQNHPSIQYTNPGAHAAKKDVQGEMRRVLKHAGVKISTTETLVDDNWVQWVWDGSAMEEPVIFAVMRAMSKEEQAAALKWKETVYTWIKMHTGEGRAMAHIEPTPTWELFLITAALARVEASRKDQRRTEKHEILLTMLARLVKDDTQLPTYIFDTVKEHLKELPCGSGDVEKWQRAQELLLDLDVDADEHDPITSDDESETDQEQDSGDDLLEEDADMEEKKEEEEEEEEEEDAELLALLTSALAEPLRIANAPPPSAYVPRYSHEKVPDFVEELLEEGVKFVRLGFQNRVFSSIEELLAVAIQCYPGIATLKSEDDAKAWLLTMITAGGAAIVEYLPHKDLNPIIEAAYEDETGYHESWKKMPREPSLRLQGKTYTAKTMPPVESELYYVCELPQPHARDRMVMLGKETPSTRTWVPRETLAMCCLLPHQPPKKKEKAHPWEEWVATHIQCAFTTPQVSENVKKLSIICRHMEATKGTGVIMSSTKGLDFDKVTIPILRALTNKTPPTTLHLNAHTQWPNVEVLRRGMHVWARLDDWLRGGPSAAELCSIFVPATLVGWLDISHALLRIPSLIDVDSKDLRSITVRPESPTFLKLWKVGVHSSSLRRKLQNQFQDDERNKECMMQILFSRTNGSISVRVTDSR